jgi:alpha-ketoglutarate-dependent taurine dioxygenase
MIDMHEYLAANNVPLRSPARRQAPRSLVLAIDAHDGASAMNAAGLCSILDARREELTRLLTEHGALLFRGFGVTTPEELAKVVEASGGLPMRYVGGDSPRTSLGGDVYTSTETPRTVEIRMHNEMSYLARYPHHLWFCCAREATRGGETTLTDGRAVMRDLDPAVRERFERLGVRYVRSLRGESRVSDLLDHVVKVTKTWMETFESSDPSVVEERCRELGVRCRWLPSGRLVMENELPAFARHPVTNEEVWFNQAHLFKLTPRTLGRLYYTLSRIVFFRPEMRSHHAQWGDGTEIDDTTIAHVLDAIERNTIAFPLRKGEILWFDNLLCMHGRRPFSGPRKILVAMTS